MANSDTAVGGLPWLEGGDLPDTSLPWMQEESPQAWTQPLNIGGIQVPGQVVREPLLFGSSALQGLESTLGLPGNLREFLESKFPTQMKNAEAGLNLLPGGNIFTQWPSGATIAANTTDKFGLGGPLTNNAAFVPQNSSERLVAGAGEGLGAAAPLAFAGPGVLLQGAAGGLAGTEAGELTNGNPLAEFAGSLIGGSLSPRLVGSVFSGKGAEALLGHAEDELAALKAARVENISKLQEALQAKASLMAAKHGSGPIDFAEAGSNIQDAARNWLEQLPQREANTWSNLDNSINGETSLEPLMDQLNELRAKGGASATAANRFTSLMPDSMRNAIALDDAPTAAWNDWRQLYQNSSDAARSGGVKADIAGQASQDLHKTVMSALGDIADRNGLFNEFADAASASERATDLANNVLPKYIAGVKASSQDPDPVALMKRLGSGLKNSPQELEQLSMIDPAIRTHIAGAILHAQEDAATSPMSGLPGWSKLSEASKAALVPDEADRALLDSGYQAYKGSAETVQRGIDDLESQVSGLRDAAKGSPAREGNEWLKIIARESLIPQLSHALGIPAAGEAALSAVNMAGPVVRRVGHVLRTNPAGVAAGALAGSSVSGLGQE